MWGVAGAERSLAAYAERVQQKRNCCEKLKTEESLPLLMQACGGWNLIVAVQNRGLVRRLFIYFLWVLAGDNIDKLAPSPGRLSCIRMSDPPGMVWFGLQVPFVD